ncbi:MAG: MDR family oxidoreductase [Pseudomonadales bacterium]
MTHPFPALVVRSPGPARPEVLTLADLPALPVLVEVACSTLNYKDALALTGRGPICRRLPMVCGIDLAGVVRESADARWPVGTPVLVNGFGLSETEWGGYSHFQRLRPEWLVRPPVDWSLADTMALGTAGYTAMLCVQAIRDHGVTVDAGPILVTGATGGVGSVAVMLLARLGYRVVASSGRPSLQDYLRGLGAAETLERAALDRLPRPLEREQWAAVVDCVGGPTLATACAQTCYGGIVTACGLAGSAELPASVMPFILRGVTLKGIDSVMAPLAVRQRAWDEVASVLAPGDLAGVTSSARLEDLPALAHDLLDGRLKGRLVVTVRE